MSVDVSAYSRGWARRRVETQHERCLFQESAVRRRMSADWGRCGTTKVVLSDVSLSVKCRGGNQQMANTLFARPAAKTNDGAWAIFHFGFINNIV